MNNFPDNITRIAPEFSQDNITDATITWQHMDDPRKDIYPYFCDYFSEKNTCAPHWREDTLEHANKRLLILKELFRDDLEALEKLENLEFRPAIDFTTGEPHLALFLKDPSVMGKFEEMFTGKGWNTRDASFATIKDTSIAAKITSIIYGVNWDIQNEGTRTNITKNEEFSRGVYFRRNLEWNILPDGYMFFKNDLTGLDADGLGTLRLSTRYKGIWSQCLAHGKTLSEIQAHLPPVHAQLQFLNQIPGDNMVRAFLTNQAIMGFAEKDQPSFSAGDSVYLASVSSQPEGVVYGPLEAGNPKDTSVACSLVCSSKRVKLPEDTWFGRHIGLQVRFLSDAL